VISAIDLWWYVGGIGRICIHVYNKKIEIEYKKHPLCDFIA
jgi:hypothetical protein